MIRGSRNKYLSLSCVEADFLDHFQPISYYLMALQHRRLSSSLSSLDETLIFYDESAAEESALENVQRAAIDEILSQRNRRVSQAGFWRAGLPPASSAYFDAVLAMIVG